MAFTSLFGENLLTEAGIKKTSEVLEGKAAVGIYFSAHWCPPCRGFTPKLAKMYEDTFKDKGMEIVFVSSDKDDTSFNDYFSTMPWSAVPFDKRDVKDALSKKFKIRGIPALVILGPDGELFTTDGRTAVTKDEMGDKFPWKPPTAAQKAKDLIEALGPELVAKAAGKPIGLYFSAHWCPPCRGFTPKLAEHYKDGLKDKMEIVFVSSDRDQGSFDEYFAEMPWQALPYEKRSEKETLSELCEVGGIPSFVVVKPDGTTITMNGRAMVSKDPKGEAFPDGWLPQPCNDVNDDPSDLNDEKCLVALGGSEALQDAVKAVAQEHYEAADKDPSAMKHRFFTAPQGNVTEQLRKLMSLPSGDKLVFLDIPSDGAFYVCDSAAPNAADVRGFIQAVSEGKVERKQLQRH